MRLPTASAVGLAVRCSYAWSHQAPPWPREPFSAAAEQGNAVHAMAEAIAEGRAPAPSPAIADFEAPLREAIAELTGGKSEVITEQPMALEVATGRARLLPKGGHRSYGNARAGELVGTADLIALNGTVAVSDFKTGRGARASHVSESWQMRTLALMARRIYDRPVEVAHIHLEPNDYRIERHRVEEWDHYGDEAELRRVVVELEGGTSVPRPGPWCTSMYCKLRTVCPATRAAMEAVSAEASRLLPPDLLTVDSPERARQARVALKLYDEAAARLKENLQAYVRTHGPVEVAPGVFYGLREQSRERIDLSVPGALAAVREAVGDSCLDIKTSKAAIERAAKGAQSKRGEGARRAQEVFATLRSLGAITTSTYEQTEEFTKNTNDTDNEGEAA